MKIIIKTLTGTQFIFEINPNINIRQLRATVQKKFGYRAWNDFYIHIMYDKNKQCLGGVFLDDPAEIGFLEFIKSYIKNPENLQLDNIEMYVFPTLGKGYRPTTSNPEGYNPGVGLLYPNEPTYTFFKPIGNHDEKHSFCEKLKKIGLTSDDIPEDFLDPITKEVMNNPVIASNQRTFDATTLELINYIDPYSRQALTKQVTVNLALRSKLESFFEKKSEEKEKKLKPSTTLMTIKNN